MITTGLVRGLCWLDRTKIIDLQFINIKLFEETKKLFFNFVRDTVVGNPC